MSRVFFYILYSASWLLISEYMTFSLFKSSHLTLLLSFIILLSSCDQKTNESSLVELSGVTMGTTYSIKINAPIPENVAEKARVDIAGILDRVDRMMSTYIPDSELSVINNNRTGDRLPVSEDLYRILEESLHISELTEGAFDITVGHLVNLWGFGPEEKSPDIPPDAAIRHALADTGYKYLELRPEPRSLLKIIPGIYIDLSAIAKGYAVDRIAEFLTGSGYKDFLVEIGGEIRTRGINAKGTVWNIGIEKPLPGERSVQRAVPLHDMAMATSGDYRNYFEIEGKRYSHTIDPRTGRPVTHNLVSVTVLDASASFADAMATGLLVLGPSAAARLAENTGIAAYLILRTDGGYDEIMTPAFSAYLNSVNISEH